MKITTDHIVRALSKASYYEAREAELQYRAALRAEMKRRRSAKGRQRAGGQAVNASRASTSPTG